MVKFIPRSEIEITPVSRRFFLSLLGIKTYLVGIITDKVLDSRVAGVTHDAIDGRVGSISLPIRRIVRSGCLG